jgi:hypothetical protein
MNGSGAHDRASQRRSPHASCLNIQLIYCHRQVRTNLNRGHLIVIAVLPVMARLAVPVMARLAVPVMAGLDPAICRRPDVDSNERSEFNSAGIMPRRIV